MEQTAGHATRTAGARRATLEADDWESGERLGGALDVATGDIGLAGDTSRATGHDISKLCGRLSPASARSAPTCLRLVHDVSIRGPGRPGWAVYCAASGEVRQRSLTVSVVIPAMNEALNLPSVLPQIPRVGTEVVIVDGHSSDPPLVICKAEIDSMISILNDVFTAVQKNLVKE